MMPHFLGIVHARPPRKRPEDKVWSPPLPYNEWLVWEIGERLCDRKMWYSITYQPNAIRHTLPEGSE
jgi:hypothetical protein